MLNATVLIPDHCLCVCFIYYLLETPDSIIFKMLEEDINVSEMQVRFNL